MKERLIEGEIEEGSYLVYRHRGSIILIRVLGVDQLCRQGILPPVCGRRGSGRRREVIPGEIKLRECRAEHRFIEGRHLRGRYTGGLSSVGGCVAGEDTARANDSDAATRLSLLCGEARNCPSPAILSDRRAFGEIQIQYEYIQLNPFIHVADVTGYHSHGEQ